MRRSDCRGVVISPGVLTCLPLFPGLPVGPRCPAIPGSPFGPISPWKEEREAKGWGHVEQVHLYRSIQSLAIRAVYLSFQIFPKWAALGDWKRDVSSCERWVGFSWKRKERRVPWVGNSLSESHLYWGAHISVSQITIQNAQRGGSCISATSVPVTPQSAGGKCFLFWLKFYVVFVLFLAQIQIYGFLNVWAHFWQLSSLGSFCSWSDVYIGLYTRLNN